MLKIVVNDDIETVNEIREALKKDKHCPCRIQKTADTICMCKEFREQNTPGVCHCGLYKKIELC